MMVNEIELISSVLTAQPNRSGFFGLTELKTFTLGQIEAYLEEQRDAPVVLDFSHVLIWDVSALLWLTVALHHYKRNSGLTFLLKLPQSNDNMSQKDRDAYDRSADYLRRWRFDRGLSCIDADIKTLLVSEQQNYFDPAEPKHFYLSGKIVTETGLVRSLISRNLAEIKNLSDPDFTGSNAIFPNNITKCIREFQAERIGDILASQCGIEKRKADLFSDQLLTEALLNVQEHPNASIGLVAISPMGNTNELILSIADNGDSIPQTIYPKYVSDKNPDSGAASGYNRDGLSTDERAIVADYATKSGITRKTGEEAVNAGMGLTYIKEGSVNTFSGKLTIITDDVHMTYSGNPDDFPCKKEWRHSWRGNLLRIAIPIKNKTV